MDSMSIAACKCTEINWMLSSGFLTQNDETEINSNKKKIKSNLIALFPYFSSFHTTRHLNLKLIDIINSRQNLMERNTAHLGWEKFSVMQKLQDVPNPQAQKGQGNARNYRVITEVQFLSFHTVLGRQISALKIEIKR